jgi:peroxiredoxin
MKLKKWWPLLLIIAGIVIVLLYQYQKYRMAPTVDVFKFGYTDTAGKNVNLYNYKGKKIIYTFWGTWCGECIQELKRLNETKKNDLQDVIVIAVSDEPLEQTKPFIQRKQYPFIFLQLDRGFPQIGINAIPVNYLINEKGEVTYARVGSIDWKDPSEISFAKENLK